MLAKDLKKGEIGLVTGLLSPIRNHKLLKLHNGNLINLTSSYIDIYKKDCDHQVELIEKINI